MKNIVVEGFTAVLKCDRDSTVTGIVSIVGYPSYKSSVGGSKVCTDGYKMSVVTVMSSLATLSDNVPQELAFVSSATTVKAVDNGKMVLLEGDKTHEATFTPQVPGSPSVPHPVIVYVEITAAGQTKVQGN